MTVRLSMGAQSVDMGDYVQESDDMTSIEWTDEVWNPVTGCSRVSEGCRNCYIERTPPFRMAGRKLGDPVQLHPERLNVPLKWKKPRRVFVNSLSDLFHDGVPFEFITAVIGVMAVRPDHTFQVLTKRPDRMRAFFQWLSDQGGFGRYIRSIRPDGDRVIPKFFDQIARTEIVNGKKVRALGDPWLSVFNAASFHMNDGRLSNVWLGVSVEDQQTADERIPILLQTPAAVRWISAEPLLGRVDLDRIDGAVLGPEYKGISISALIGGAATDTPWHLNWVVVGGESGPKARPTDLAHIRAIVDQCQAATVPVFVKQLGSKWFDRAASVAVRGTVRVVDDGRPMLWVSQRDAKGGDWSDLEFPEDLKVREWPA